VSRGRAAVRPALSATTCGRASALVKRGGFSPPPREVAGAEGGTRTPTGRTLLRPERSASTSSTTSAHVPQSSPARDGSQPAWRAAEPALPAAGPPVAIGEARWVRAPRPLTVCISYDKLRMRDVHAGGCPACSAKRALTPGLRSRAPRRGQRPLIPAGDARQGEESAQDPHHGATYCRNRAGANPFHDVAGRSLILSGTARQETRDGPVPAAGPRVRDRLRTRRGSTEASATRGRGS
jgi:hypothetical protein